MREDANFMTLHLIFSAAFMFGVSGGQPVPGFNFVLRNSGFEVRAFDQLAFVIFEILVNALQFAAQIILLALLDALQIGGQFFGQNRLQ